MTNTGILWTLLVLGLHLRLTHAEAGSSETATTKAPAITAAPTNPPNTNTPSNPVNSVTSALPATSATSDNPTSIANPANPTSSANHANPAPTAPTATSVNPAPTAPTATSVNPAPTAPTATSVNPAPIATSANPVPSFPTATSVNPAPTAPTATSVNPAPIATSVNPAPSDPIATSVNPAPSAPTANPAPSAHPATPTNPAITNSPVNSVDDKSQSGKQEGTSKPPLAQSSQSLATSSSSHAPSPSASATTMDKSSQNSATKLSDTTDKTAFTNQETATKRIAEDYKTTGQSTEGSEKDTRQHHSSSSLPKAETNDSNNTFRVTYLLQDNMEQNQTDILFKVCMKQFKGPGVINCTLGGTIENNHHIFTMATAGGDLSVTQEIYDKIKEEHKEIPTLIIILASCGGLAAMLLAFAVYCTCHRRSYRKNQQHLTEELQTVENGYHDNPTLEVMEVQPEMQEKKLPLNGEFNDSWMVPLDNLTKEDIADEEDTHL